MNEYWATQLRREFGFDDKQVTIATNLYPTKSGYRRVRGSAGSGKSLALAARAAVLASEGKQVLVCTFVKPLVNYLRYLVEQFIPNGVSVQPEVINFHKWCRNVCPDSFDTCVKNYRHKYGLSSLGNEFWWEWVPELISEIYDKDAWNTLPTYDAILVDEAHDFDISGWQTLRKALKEDGEMLLVCDKTQDIHGNAHKWTDEAMSNCGFEKGGRWMELDISYRLPVNIFPMLEDFFARFPFKGEHYIPKAKPGLQKNLFDKFQWIPVDTFESDQDVCIKVIEDLYNDPDICTVYFVTASNKIGKLVAEKFKQRGIDILDTYSSDWRQSHDAKINFKPGCADICATTVHSFKGWEASHLVVHVEDISTETDKRLFYTALSRLKEDPKGTTLAVVSSCSELAQFGRKHFEFKGFSPTNFDSHIEDDIPF